MRLIVYATVNNGLFRNLAVTRITFVSLTPLTSISVAEAVILYTQLSAQYSQPR